MADGCNVNLTCRLQDVPRFLALGFSLEYDAEVLEPLPAIELVADELMHGAREALQALGQEGIPFYGAHGDCGDFAVPSLFVAANGESIWVPHLDYEPVVPVLDAEGRLAPVPWERAKTYYRLEEAALKLIGAVETQEA